MTRRVRAIVFAVVVVLIAVAGCVVVHALEDRGDARMFVRAKQNVVRMCYPISRKWQRRGVGSRVPVVFGADYFRQVVPLVRVTKVSLVGVHPAGSLVLAKAALVPEGGATIGYRWPSRWLSKDPHWSEHVMIPSRTELRPPKEDWQVVLGLTLRHRGGSLSGVRLTLESGGHTSTVTTLDTGKLIRKRPGRGC